MDNPVQPLPPLTFCVVNFNGEQYLENTLEALLLQKRDIDEVLLIDNCSTDQSVAIVERGFPAVRIISLDENQGPGAARNAGLQQAGNDLILFIDNDVVLQTDCVTGLAGALQGSPKAVAAAPRVLYAENAGIIQFEGANAHYLGLMMTRNANRRSTGCPVDVSRINSIVTACFLLDHRRWGARELFDESFFFNYEDHDFGVRARILGHDLLAVPGAVVLHRGGTPGLSWRPGREYSRTRVNCLIRNRWQVILKNYSLKTIVLLLPCLFIYEIFQLVGIAKKGWLGEWPRAFFWTLAHSRQILERRKNVQRSRACPDRAVLTDGPLPFTEDLATTGLERAGKGLLNNIVTGYWLLVGRFI
jgi:hypothetical protein